MALKSKFQNGWNHLRTPTESDPERPERFLVVAIVLALGLMLFPFLWKPWVHGNDGVRHFSYCRSLWLDGDLNFTNEFEHYMEVGELEEMVIDKASGKPGNSQGIGSALLWSPFFLAGHVAALVGPWEADGYSAPYVWMISLGTTLYALAGLGLLCLVLGWRFGPWPALLASLGVWLGSPLVFYMYLHPSMAHGCSFFLICLLLWMYERWRNIQYLRHFFLIGLVTGLAMVTRMNNGVMLLVAGCFWFRAYMLGLPDEDRYYNNRGLFWTALFLCMGLFVGAFPQMAAWRYFYDAWLAGPRDYHLGESMAWFKSPHLPALFISGWRGLFVWSPVLFPAFIGWLLLLRRRRYLDVALLIGFAWQAWVIGGWWAWYGGASFGQRFFINFIPALAMGLAWFFLCLREGLMRNLLLVYILISLLWNGGLAVQYGSRMIDREGPVLTRELVRNQLTRVPRELVSHLRFLAPTHRLQEEDRPPDGSLKNGEGP